MLVPGKRDVWSHSKEDSVFLRGIIKKNTGFCACGYQSEKEKTQNLSIEQQEAGSVASS